MRFLGPDADAADELATFDQIPDNLECFTFAHQSTLTTGSGTSRKYMQYAGSIVAIRISVGTAPTSASVIVDVNKNGSAVTTSGNRASISASQFTGSTTTFSNGTFSAGDYMTVDIDQVGSSNAGADLVVDIYYRRS